jgi:hypothetical protein
VATPIRRGECCTMIPVLVPCLELPALVGFNGTANSTDHSKLFYYPHGR